MRIVFLKLADEKGVTQKAVAALRKKYPEYRSSGLRSWFSRSSWSEWMTNDNKVTEVSLIPLYQEWTSPRLSIAFLDAMVDVWQKCANADKIMLGIHGEPGDTTCAYIDLFGHNQAVTYQQLARFIYLFLPDLSRPLRLSLIMCFGARSTNARINHMGALTEMQVKSSFAYKFFKQLVQRRDVVMTARTGAIGFSDIDGRALVQTEAAVNAQLDDEELQRSPELQQVSEAYENLFQQASATGGREAVRALSVRRDRIEEELNRGRTDWRMASFDDLIMVDYLRLKKVVQRLSDAKNVDSPKYGKFVYRYDRPTATVTVRRKYPNPALLYTGAL